MQHVWKEIVMSLCNHPNYYNFNYLAHFAPFGISNKHCARLMNWCSSAHLRFKMPIVLMIWLDSTHFIFNKIKTFFMRNNHFLVTSLSAQQQECACAMSMFKFATCGYWLRSHNGTKRLLLHVDIKPIVVSFCLSIRKWRDCTWVHSNGLWRLWC